MTAWCDQKVQDGSSCGKEATVRYTWPGRDESFACAEHGAKLATVANAIGVHLQTIPITDEGQTIEGLDRFLAGLSGAAASRAIHLARVASGMKLALEDQIVLVLSPDEVATLANVRRRALATIVLLSAGNEEE